MTATTDTSALLRTDEAAALLRVSRRTVRRLLASGELHGFRVGRQWRIATTDLDARLLPVPRRRTTDNDGRNR